MKYKVIYHAGESIGLKTRVASGQLWVEDELVRIEGATPISIPLSQIQNLELFRLHGLGRMIKLVHTEGTLFLSVVRINLFGAFVIINFFKTGRLYETLNAEIPPHGRPTD